MQRWRAASSARFSTLTISAAPGPGVHALVRDQAPHCYPCQSSLKFFVLTSSQIAGKNHIGLAAHAYPLFVLAESQFFCFAKP